MPSITFDTDEGCVMRGWRVSTKCTDCPLSVCKYDDLKTANLELKKLIEEAKVCKEDDSMEARA